MVSSAGDAIERSQHRQHRDAARERRRTAVNTMLVVVNDERLTPTRLVIAKVGLCQRRAGLFSGSDNPIRNLALVKRFRPFVGNQSQSCAPSPRFSSRVPTAGVSLSAK